jgi:hypothetical protein
LLFFLDFIQYFFQFHMLSFLQKWPGFAESQARPELLVVWTSSSPGGVLEVITGHPDIIRY